MSGFVSSRYYTQYKTECAQVEISAALSPADTTHDTGQNVLGWKYQRLCLQQILHMIQDRMCSGGNISGFVSSKYYTQYRTECAQMEISAALSPADTTHNTGQNVLRWKYQWAILSPVDTTHNTGQNVLKWKYERLCLQ